ncbi:DUF1449 family protein [Hymenobacter aerilatus]|uniref:DUF1449 family protein n=1 Tax=Hymenobacter aerilatus TaxID=2932251 RepID=A0A8T9SXA6_9BACT|nr:OB-fold-containig protein [Hymenobacter aerilatus]UOR06367.1 DUF1449 family protein [Hymenobacter aerilatus]
MTELLQAAVSPPNLVPTGLLVFVLLYWLTVMVGLVHLDALDVDVAADADAGVDLDTHAGPHLHHGEVGTDWLNNALAFFNLGRVPLMVFLSFVALPLWAGSVLLNYYTHNSSWLVGIVFLAPLLVGSLLLAKVLTTPFVKLFAALEKDHDAGASPVGKICTVVLPATREQMGQAAVRIASGAPLMLNVRAASATELRKGDSALVIDFDAQQRCYLIEPYER